MYDLYNVRPLADKIVTCSRREPMLAARVERLRQAGQTYGPAWNRAVEERRRNRLTWRAASRAYRRVLRTIGAQA